MLYFLFNYDSFRLTFLCESITILQEPKLTKIIIITNKKKKKIMKAYAREG